jgi:hypothetical protein
MRPDQIRRTWSGALIDGLRERYELTEQEARMKVDQWIESLRYVRASLPADPESRRRRVPRQQNTRVRGQSA